MKINISQVTGFGDCALRAAIMTWPQLFQAYLLRKPANYPSRKLNVGFQKAIETMLIGKKNGADNTRDDARDAANDAMKEVELSPADYNSRLKDDNMIFEHVERLSDAYASGPLKEINPLKVNYHVEAKHKSSGLTISGRISVVSLENGKNVLRHTKIGPDPFQRFGLQAGGYTALFLRKEMELIEEVKIDLFRQCGLTKPQEMPTQHVLPNENEEQLARQNEFFLAIRRIGAMVNQYKSTGDPVLAFPKNCCTNMCTDKCPAKNSQICVL